MQLKRGQPFLSFDRSRDDPELDELELDLELELELLELWDESLELEELQFKQKRFHIGTAWAIKGMLANMKRWHFNKVASFSPRTVSLPPVGRPLSTPIWTFRPTTPYG